MSGFLRSVQDSASLVSQGKFDEAVDSIKSQANWESDKDALSGIAKAQLAKAKSLANSGSSGAKKLYSSALDHARKAVAADPSDRSSHSLVASILGQDVANKSKSDIMKNFEQYKNEALSAGHQLDAQGHSLLGEYHYARANPNWWEKMFFNTFFGASSAEKEKESAMNAFKEANRLDPSLSSRNDLMLGKVMIELQNQDSNLAKAYLNKVITAYSSSTDSSDQSNVAEAKKLLESLNK